MLFEGDREMKCNWCNETYCARCKQKSHEEFDCVEIDREKDREREMRIVNKAEVREGDLLLKSESRQCPRCKDSVVLERGCKFIACPWPRCAGTYFCAICLKSLTVKYI